MRFIVAIAFVSCFLISNAQTPFAVVELFTSEGCSSCPPAEKVFKEIKEDAEKNQKNIFFLEYHVDYWNGLGWKDPFSKFQFTKRQQNYTSALSEKNIYTPMLLVNGHHPITGSDEEAVNSNIRAALEEKTFIRLSATIDSIANDTAFVSYNSSKTDKNYFLRFAITEDNLASNITKGENSGKKLNHKAVVRIFTTIDLKANMGTIAIPLKKINLINGHCSLIVFIQHKQTMRILAATSTSIKTLNDR